MPEAYTHLRTARAAAKMARLSIADPAAFAAGANGPDMLFCYRVWRKAEKRGVNLPALGAQMHEQETGAVLRSLIEHACSPAERSYVLGFLCHYAPTVPSTPMWPCSPRRAGCTPAGAGTPILRLGWTALCISRIPATPRCPPPRAAPAYWARGWP